MPFFGRLRAIGRASDHKWATPRAMKIRPATIADVPELVSLNSAVQRMHVDAFPERFRKDAPDGAVADAFLEMIRSESTYWLVAEEGPVAGFLSAEFRQRDESWCMKPHRACYLSGIVVLPEFRRRGIAQALLEELKTEASRRDVAQIELDVWSFNEEAKEAFQKLGFHPIMERMIISAARPSH